jgi:hypothetical protein
MPGGGLMQLIAYGGQDVYLTSNPQISFFKFYNKKIEVEVKIRLIDSNDKNIECPISYNNISYGNKYYKCIQCQYNFDYESFQVSGVTDKCPLCRKTNWINNIIYHNVEN